MQLYNATKHTFLIKKMLSFVTHDNNKLWYFYLNWYQIEMKFDMFEVCFISVQQRNVCRT